LKQFGASVGGPIKKDKLFFFGNYEGQRYTVGSTFTINTPITCAGGSPGCGLTTTNPATSLVDACNSVAAISGGGFSPVGTPGKVTWLSAQIAGISIDPVTGCKIAAPNYTPGTSESLFPANNGSGLSTLLGLISNNQQDNGVGKLDYHINDRNSLTGMYFRGQGGGIWNDSATEPGIAGASSSPFMSNLHGIAQLVSAGWTWTPNSNWVNELRFGYAYYHQIYLSVDANVNPLAYGINTGVTDPGFFGFPSIRISGGPNVRLGGNWPKISGPDGSMQFSDHVSVLRGKHAFKFGGEITSNKVMPFITTNGKGSFRFSNLSNYLKGVERNTGTVSQILLGNPLRHISNQQYAAFLQDDWRLTPRLTVNLGLRYELTTVIKDRDNQLGNFDPNSPTGLVQVGSGLSSIFNGDHNNFSPRIGFAWDVQGNGKTVVRAGGNVMYAHLPIDVFTNIANLLGLNLVPTGAAYVVNGVTTQGTGNMGVIQINVFGGASTPFTQAWQNQTSTCVSTGSAACGAIFPTKLQCGTGLGTDPAPCNTEAVDRNLRTPYISTWSLDVQRAFTNNLSLDVAYVGTHGTKLLGFQDINQPPIGTGNANFGTCALSGTQKTVANCEQIARPFFGKFPYLAQIDQLSNLDHSNYNALQVTLTQRTTHGLSFIAGYTFAHSLDEASSNWNANTLPPDSSRPGLQYGNSDFDIRHRGTFSLNYAIPGRSGFGQMLKGWELNSIVTLQTGQPWGGRDTTNDFTGNGQVGELASFGQPWNFFGNPSDFTSGPNAIPFFTPDPASGPNPTNPKLASSNSTCLANASAASLGAFGCFVRGSSVLVPPAPGTLGNAGRNIFRDSGFRVWDMSVAKRFQFKERLSAQFRTEFFNILNHPIFTNPGGPGGAGFNDPSGSNFGCGCFTPDTAATNPVLGSGGARSIQLGLKLIW
jgi:hypothetical protein